MTKLKFLLSLHDRLSALPKDELEGHLSFYSEMIEDRMEEGVSEEEAVSAVGSVDEIAVQILANVSLGGMDKKEEKTKRRLKAWEIALLVLGSPLWLSLLIAVAAVMLLLYAVLWSVVISLWAVCASFAGCAFGGLCAGAGFVFGGNGYTGIALMGAGFVCAGLAILLFFGSRAATKSTLLLTKQGGLWVIKCLSRKEEA